MHARGKKKAPRRTGAAPEGGVDGKGRDRLMSTVLATDGQTLVLPSGICQPPLVASRRRLCVPALLSRLGVGRIGRSQWEPGKVATEVKAGPVRGVGTDLSQRPWSGTTPTGAKAPIWLHTFMDRNGRAQILGKRTGAALGGSVPSQPSPPPFMSTCTETDKGERR